MKIQKNLFFVQFEVSNQDMIKFIKETNQEFLFDQLLNKLKKIQNLKI